MDKPAMIIELKWDKNVQGAIAQIEDKKYTDALKNAKQKALIFAGAAGEKIFSKK